MIKKLGMAIGFVSIVSGCATITTPSQELINIKASNNKAIEVTVDDQSTVTPGAVTVLRNGEDKVVRTSAEGCDNATPVKKNVTPLFFGNIIIGGLLGSTTDGLSGKMWDYEDDVIISCPEQ